MWFCDVSLLEREVSPADRARDPEAEGAGRGARPGAQGVAGEAAAQEEGTVLGLRHTASRPRGLEHRDMGAWRFFFCVCIIN